MAEEKTTTKPDQPTDDAPATPVTPVEAPEAKETIKPTASETTIAKDSEILINTPTATAEPKPTTETPSAKAEDAPTVASKPLVDEPAAVSAPIVVTEQDAKAEEAATASPEPAITPTTTEANLGEEIEVLTGEVQALESKIERLTNGAEPAESKSATPPEPAEPATPETPATPSTPATPPVVPAFEPKAPSSSSTINDIYSRQNDAVKKNSTELSREMSDTTVLNDDKPPSSPMGTIGEIMAVFGFIAFVILLLSPLYKELIGADAYDAVKSIGWLTTLASLALGFIFLLFAKGRWATKILILILLVVAAIIYLGITNSTLLSSVTNLFSPLLVFYR